MKKLDIEELTNKALEAFWDVVVDHCQNAKTGDLSPLATFQLDQAAKSAIQEWIENNVPRKKHA